MDNRHAIDLIRALTASSALFIPSNTPYREILMEGVYSLSQLISLVNHSFFDPAQRNNRPLMHALNLITTIISNVEVFVEGVSNLFGSTAYKNLMVLIIEASKASCRLISMLSSKKNCILLNWGKGDNATAAQQQPDLSDYLSHYTSACSKILRNLNAKSPALFQLSQRPTSLRVNAATMHMSAVLHSSSTSTVHNTSVLSGASNSASSNVHNGASNSFASPADKKVHNHADSGNSGYNRKLTPEEAAAMLVQEQVPPKAAFQGRRSGIQLNASAFDSIPLRAAMQTTGNITAINTSTTNTANAAYDSTAGGVYGINMQSGDNISPASATTTHSAASDEHSIYADNNLNSTANNVRNIGEAPYSTISSRTLPPEGHIYTANYADNMVNYGANFDPGSPTSAYKDNSPGSIYPPPVSYDYNTTPYNYGVRDADSSCVANSIQSTSTGLTDTPYMSTDYIMSYNGTPYRAKHSGDYSQSAPSSGTKITLEFEPESDEIVSSSVDSSFDCEVIFTSIYTGSPATLQNAAATAANTTANGTSNDANGTSGIVHDVDTFVGENEHFKNNYLEQVNAPKSPDNGWAGTKRAAYLYTGDGSGENSVYTGIGANAEGVGNSGSPGGDPGNNGGTSTSAGAGNYMNNSGASGGTSGKKASMFSTAAAMFDLGAEDALKLGEMLYILRPLIYAVLVHQIELHRQNRDSASNTSNTSNTGTSNTTSSDTTHTNTSTSSSGSSAYALLSTTCGINSTVARIAEYIASASNSAVNATVSRVLDVVSVDALLSALALAVSFVIEFLSIQLTHYALLTLRNKARDDGFIANIGTYLIPPHNTQNNPNNAQSAWNNGSLNLGSRDSRMPQNALTRKRVYDVYSSECGKMAHKHAYDQELSRRRMALFLYLIRSPIFDRATYPLLKVVAETAKNIPLVGALPEYALGLLSYLNKMHFYNSNS